VALVLLAACIPTLGPSLRPIEPVEPTELQWARVLPPMIAAADGVTVSTIVKLEQDWTYDSHCGIIAAIMHRCDSPATYQLTLSNGLRLWTWTQGDFGLHVGERATFVWTYQWVTRRFECEERSGMSSQGCLTDKLETITDDLDVLPAEDFARAASLKLR
jgi:hypothetical protein